ncbi:MAG: polysaccharide deacetylase family protein [Magnetospirillum sp.]|nr:polysaccharide deacetylase family protein [Magnetospirillum sp.]
MRNSVFLAVALAVLAGWAGTSARAADSAVVFTYNRFGDSRFPAANTRLDQLDDQIAELKAGGYWVLPLSQVVEALQRGKPLPDKAVALSIDDTWASVWQEAWPRFKAAGLPVTLFLITDEIDRGGPDRLNWDNVREMAASGLVTIATQGAGHPHLPALPAALAAEDLARARARIQAELGQVPDLFAWPYGEMSREAAEIVRQAGFKAAFGQHSGPIWSRSDWFFLPRFPLNETYGEAERFRLAARSLPLPAVDVTPDDPRLGANPPAFGFTLSPEVPGAEPAGLLHHPRGPRHHRAAGPTHRGAHGQAAAPGPLAHQLHRPHPGGPLALVRLAVPGGVIVFPESGEDSA